MKWVHFHLCGNTISISDLMRNNSISIHKITQNPVINIINTWCYRTEYDHVIVLLKAYHSHLQIGKNNASNLISLSAYAASINEHQVSRNGGNKNSLNIQVHLRTRIYICPYRLIDKSLWTKCSSFSVDCAAYSTSYCNV